MSTNGSDEIAAAEAFLARSEAGKHVLRLLEGTLTKRHFRGLAAAIAPFVMEQAHSARQAVVEIEANVRAFIAQQERRERELTARVAAVERRFGEFEAKRIGELEARANMLELQLAKSLKNGGTWKSSAEFEPGDVATYKGCAWVCQIANSNERPGTSDAWRLMHKTTGG